MTRPDFIAAATHTLADAREGDTVIAALGIPVETLRGLRDGSLVAVPVEPTEAWWNSVAVRLDAHPSSLFMERLRDAHAQLILAALADEGDGNG